MSTLTLFSDEFTGRNRRPTDILLRQLLTRNYEAFGKPSSATQSVYLGAHWQSDGAGLERQGAAGPIWRPSGTEDAHHTGGYVLGMQIANQPALPASWGNLASIKSQWDLTREIPCG
jgi:hypothetical protein